MIPKTLKIVQGAWDGKKNGKYIKWHFGSSEIFLAISRQLFIIFTVKRRWRAWKSLLLNWKSFRDSLLQNATELLDLKNSKDVPWETFS